MSGIRVNEWLHNSGTGGIWQTSAGNVGIASSVPTAKLVVTGDANISGVATAAAFVPSAGQLSHRNLFVNGAMQVAQRGSSHTSDEYTVDQFKVKYAAEDEMATHAQVTLTSSDTGPWEKGLRKAVQITNGNQTGGAGAGDYARTVVKIEAQHLASSGWEYTSASSYITLSFWVKSSVAQTFHAFWYTSDGTSQQYPFSFALSANTWTKVIKTIPGNSNVQIDSNADAGMSLYIYQFAGTNFTDAGVTLNAWGAYSSSAQTPNDTSTWYTTNDSTFSYTGFQLEVGEIATPFEHRSYQDDLLRCQRYYQRLGLQMLWAGRGNGSATFVFGVPLAVPLRASPNVIAMSGTLKVFEHDASSESTNVPTAGYGYELGATAIALAQDGHSGLTDDRVMNGYIHGSGSYLSLAAEL